MSIAHTIGENFMELQNIEIRYTNRTILSGVNCTIKKGEFVFLIGASGSGKTSFIRSIIWELSPFSWTVITDTNQDLYKLSQKDLAVYRRKIWVVFQDFKLLDSRTVRENVAFAMEVSGYSDRVIMERIPEVLTEVWLLHKMNTPIPTLSGWEAQRVWIARALIHHPDILIGDEPTGNLDPETAKEIMGIFDRLNKEGRTVIISSHDASIVDSMKKRLIEFSNGTIVRDVTNGLYDWSTR